MPIILALVAIVGVLGLATASILLRGWVLSVLWGWFLVPTLGLPHLGIAQALGISTVLSLFLAGLQSEDTKDTSKAVGILASPLAALLIGWIIHLFM